MTVWVADTSAERQVGLSGVTELPSGVAGMLFEFESPRSVTFTMKDTTIPLDIWWFDEEGLVIGSTVMDPCQEEPCVNYRSPAEIAWALETPLGEFVFEPGDRLTNVESG